MLLAVDVGNTQTVLGLFEARVADRALAASPPSASAPATSSASLLSGLLDLDSVDGICLSSTVPALVREWELRRGALGAGAGCSSSARASRPASRSATTTRARSGPTGS